MRWILLLVSGGLTSVGVLFPELFLISAVGLYIFYYSLDHLGTGSLRATALVGWCFGVSYCGGTIFWLWDVLPLDWLGFSNTVFAALILSIIWGTVSISLGTFFGFFAVVFSRFKSGDILSDAFFGAALWTIIQYAQMWGYYVLTLGPGSLFGAHFTPMMLGYAVSGLPSVLHFARYGGIYALTFIFFFALYSTYRAFQKFRLHGRLGMAECIVLTIVIILAIGVLPLDPIHESRQITFGLVTTYFGANSPITLDKQIDMVQDIITQDRLGGTIPDVYILPEGIAFFKGDSFMDDPQTWELLNEHKISMVTSLSISTPSRHVRMYFHDSGNLVATYDKRFLTPLGEYPARVYTFLLAVFGENALVAKSVSEHALSAGRNVVVADIQGARIGALFCFDILAPDLFRQLVKDGAEVLVDVTSIAWFHGSKIVDSLLLSMARVRAVENNRFILLSSNMMRSTIISNTGEIIQRSPEGELSVLKVTAPLNTNTTPYTRLGNFVLVPLFLLVAWRITRNAVRPRSLVRR